MASENVIIGAIDIGTTRILALIAEMDSEGRVYVIGHGEAPSVGLKRGIVVDMDKTVQSIRRAMDDAQMISAVEMDRVTVGIAGEHIRSINSHGVIAVNRSDNEITSADVRKAIDAARAVAIPVDREIIHVIPQEFSVDDQPGIKDPVGMSGVRLEVEAHIVTASVATAKNIYRALERCRFEIDHIVLESLALSQVLLSESEMDMGVYTLDIGGDLTNVSVFNDGAIRHTAVVPVGSKHISNDIAIGLRTSLDQAEALKLNYGSAMASLVDPEEMVIVPGVAGRPDKSISKNVLASIIEPRMEEIFSLALSEIKRSGVAESPTGGLVLSGGGSLLHGTVELAEQIFDVPVRIGQISGVDLIPDGMDAVRAATGLGLLLYGFNNEPIRRSGSGRMQSFFKRMENWITRKL